MTSLDHAFTHYANKHHLICLSPISTQVYTAQSLKICIKLWYGQNTLFKQCLTALFWTEILDVVPGSHSPSLKVTAQSASITTETNVSASQSFSFSFILMLLSLGIIYLYYYGHCPLLVHHYYTSWLGLLWLYLEIYIFVFD